MSTTPCNTFYSWLQVDMHTQTVGEQQAAIVDLLKVGISCYNRLKLPHAAEFELLQVLHLSDEMFCLSHLTLSY